MKGWFLAGNWRFDLLARRQWARYYVIEHAACERMPLRTSRYDAHGLLPDVGAWWWKLWLSRVLRAYLVNKTIAVSEGVAARLSEEYWYPRRRMEIMRNGTDPSRFVLDGYTRAAVRAEWGVNTESEFVFGAVSRLVPVKRVDRTLRAFDALHRRLAGKKNMSLTIVGEGPEEQSLRQLVDELGLNNKVRFKPFSTEPERIYCGLDAFVLASDNEGLPLSLCEAMACGVVPIVTDAAGSGEVVNSSEVGRLVRRGDMEELVGAMSWVTLMDQAEREAVGAAARQRIVNHFSLADQVGRIIELVECGRSVLLGDLRA